MEIMTETFIKDFYNHSTSILEVRMKNTYTLFNINIAKKEMKKKFRKKKNTRIFFFLKRTGKNCCMI